MKVHRIITTIEVENDNSITSIELIHLYLADGDIPLAITNITTNGGANDIKQVYYSISGRRLIIASKLKAIARHINESLNIYKFDKITNDDTINKFNDDGIL